MKCHKSMIALSVLFLTCKHATSESKLAAIYAGQSVDALTLSQSLVDAPAACRFHLINLLADSLSEGLLRNGAISGLGTANPAGKKLGGDGLYFQAVRMISIFDWELGMRLAANESGCLIDQAGLQLGVYPVDYTRQLGHPFAADVAKIKKAAVKVNGSLNKFEVLSLEAAEKIEAWPQGSGYPAVHQKALLQGMRDKVKYTQNAISQNTDEQAKLKGLAAAFSPFVLTFQGAFKGGSGARIYGEAYLPPLNELAADDWDKVSTWRLTPGLSRYQLKKPVNIAVAVLTHVSYLSERDVQSQPLIKVQMMKDFAQPDRLATRVLFGRLDPEGSEKGVIPIDFKNYRDAFHVSFYPNISVSKDDNGMLANFKRQFNEIANQIRIDARIHQLTLNLVRPPEAVSGDADNLRLLPHFSLKDSDISFRMHRYTADSGERRALGAVGFRCQPQAADAQFDCFIDFGAYTDLSDFVLKGDQGVAHGRLATVLADAFKALLRSVIRYNVKYIVDWNIHEIEDAIDKELIAMADEFTSSQVDGRRRIQDKLESRLFAKDASE